MPNSDKLSLALALLLLLVVGVTIAEGVYLHRRNGSYNWRAYFASLGDAICRPLVTKLVGTGLFTAMLALAVPYRIGNIPMNTIGSWLVLIVAQDFCYYWLHRMDHRINWFWASHSVHHSSNAYNLAAAFRLGWTARFTGSTILYTPLILVGFPLSAVLTAIVINTVYQFWLHTALVPKLGPLEWVFNTPAHHRIHHASNPTYLDRNYGGILIIYDRLFGTFIEEQAGIECRYGLTTPYLSNNPLRIALHGWAKLLFAIKRAKGLREITRIVLGPPALLNGDKR